MPSRIMSKSELVVRSADEISIILDGEMLVWDPSLEKYLAFGTLKTAALGKLLIPNVADSKIEQGTTQPQDHVVSSTHFLHAELTMQSRYSTSST
jgi:hypothetical protein